MEATYSLPNLDSLSPFCHFKELLSQFMQSGKQTTSR